MRKPDKIQLSMPMPCSAEWAKMTPCEQGRHCAQCQTTIVDFTTWTDKQLFDFFSREQGKVCGRLSDTQLNRDLVISPQPKSHLYRIVIACGLTLMFTQMAEAHPRVRHNSQIFSEVTMNEVLQQPIVDSTDTTGSITGIAIDENEDPVIGAIIDAYQNSEKKGSTVTDIDGFFTVKGLMPGEYEIIGKYSSYKSLRILKIQVKKEKETKVNLQFQPNKVEWVGYVKPLIRSQHR